MKVIRPRKVKYPIAQRIMKLWNLKNCKMIAYLRQPLTSRYKYLSIIINKKKLKKYT